MAGAMQMVMPAHRYAPDRHARPERTDEPNWRWVHLWDVENPAPPDRRAFAAWYAERRKVQDRTWVAYCLPQFLVWDWSDEDVALARRLVSGHVCGVCGVADDPGCWINC